jgi:hypothetical protein
MMTRVRMLMSVLLLAPSCARSHVASNVRTVPPQTLVGVWQLVSVIQRDASGGTNSFPSQPGLRIFTPTYYSFVEVTSEQPRPVPSSQATATELLAAFGPFAAQAGTYEIRGDTITLYPLVAKNPDRMSAGYWRKEIISLRGDTLSLTIGPNASGPTTGSTYRFVRVE